MCAEFSELHVIYSMIHAKQQQGMARWRVTTGASIVCSSVYSIKKEERIICIRSEVRSWLASWRATDLSNTGSVWWFGPDLSWARLDRARRTNGHHVGCSHSFVTLTYSSASNHLSCCQPRSIDVWVLDVGSTAKLVVPVVEENSNFSVYT